MQSGVRLESAGMAAPSIGAQWAHAGLSEGIATVNVIFEAAQNGRRLATIFGLAWNAAGPCARTVTTIGHACQPWHRTHCFMDPTSHAVSGGHP